ncbi:hypothetical protein EVG20_g630 [Dentipellis fragilis]|uniref:Uncharacterized protein n=1 Tax=Dentipellis fragilis TaxID=205917 RepID=A0A4Y9ZC78_9AGAM|nr:hypothetical protein EVG20_g630 [Dentipellis fragilis]
MSFVQRHAVAGTDPIAHVNQLSSELLSNIFHILQVIHLGGKYHVQCGYYWKEVILRIHGWFRVTHVCRQWRFVALHHAPLWSNILVNLGPIWMNELFTRSRMTPISFKCESWPPRKMDERDVVGVVTQHLPHMRELVITGKSKHLPLISSSLRRAAPVLEKATLVDETRPSDGRCDPRLQTLPMDLFGQIAPRLHDLEIRRFNFAMTWSSLVFSNMVNLSLSRWDDDFVVVAENESGEQGFHQFLGALSRMPKLEILRLSSVMPPLPDGVTTQSSFAPLVSLPNLHTFELGDQILKCVVALQLITIPLSTKCHITCALDRGHECGSELILPWLASRFSALPPIRVLERPKYQEHSHFLTTGDLHYHLCFEGFDRSAGEDGTIRELQKFCMALPLEHLEILNTDLLDQSVWEVQDWITVFRQCKNVHDVEAKEYCPVNLCKALTLDSSAAQYPKDGLTTPLFPSLRTLTLEDINDFEEHNFHKKLPDWVWLRKRLAPLQRINIMMTNIDDKPLYKLRYHVPVLLDHSYLRVVLYHSDDEFGSSEESDDYSEEEDDDSSKERIGWIAEDDYSSEEGDEFESDLDGDVKFDDQPEFDAASTMDWTSD